MANFGETPVQRACAAADGPATRCCTRSTSATCARTQFFVEWMALDLVRDAEGVVGVVAYEMETGAAMILHAKATVLATGGRTIFAASTNAFINTGDGLGMAARAGIPLEDLEFWQFHPTGVAGAGVLIPRACAARAAYCSTVPANDSWSATRPTRRTWPRATSYRAPWTRRSGGPGCGPEKDHVLLKLDHLGRT